MLLKTIIENRGRECYINVVIFLMELIAISCDVARFEALGSTEFSQKLKGIKEDVLRRLKQERIDRMLQKNAFNFIADMPPPPSKKRRRKDRDEARMVQVGLQDCPLDVMSHIYMEKLQWRMAVKSNCWKCKYPSVFEHGPYVFNLEEPDEWDGKVSFNKKSIDNCPMCPSRQTLLQVHDVVLQEADVYAVQLSTVLGMNAAPRDGNGFCWRGIIFRKKDHFYAVVRVQDKLVLFDDSRKQQLSIVGIEKLKWKNAYIVFYSRDQNQNTKN